MGLLAQEHCVRLALVGGIPRDILLQKNAGQDIDLVVEGDAIHLARAWHEKTGGDLQCFHAFHNASLRTPLGQYDFVRARSESYPHPAALPEVSPASLEEDLGRRDFRIASMAIDLTPSGLGNLIDPHGGLQDLEERRLEVFHPNSITDDPTRALRATRYATRLDLELGDLLLESIDMALASEAFCALSIERFGQELQRLFHEEKAPEALEMAASLGLLDHLPLDPFSLDAAAGDLLMSRHSWPGDPVAPSDLLWLLLADRMSDREEWVRLIPGGKDNAKRFLQGTQGIRGTLEICEKTNDRGEHGAALSRLDPSQCAFAWFLSPHNPALVWWESQGRAIRSDIGSTDLLSRGWAPGKILGRALLNAQKAAWSGATAEAQLLAALGTKELS